MDDLYGNLENYNEENRISELQAENRELKYKLEEYTATLTKLQKDILQDFDMLSSEYKKLETNYSSLLKTAKAEIERKTQIITNLNKEKDKMVLMCHQNKNTRPGRTRDHSNTLAFNNKMDAQTKPERNNKLRKFEGSRNQSPHPSTERKEQDSLPTSLNPRSKFINLPNTSNHHDSRSEKDIEFKENIQNKKVADSGNTSASIRNRRKSMPAISIEKDQFSSDEDDGGSAAKDQNWHHKQKHADYNHHERPKSRISETSSLDEKKQNHYYESESLSHKQRSSMYDKEPTDRYRARHKSSGRYKRQSPDRYPNVPRDYHHRSHPDTNRSRERDSETRLPHHKQERYVTKRKTEHGYDEAHSKRARLDPTHQHHKLEQRIEDNRKFTHDKYLTDPPNIQFSSCESPDYNNLEISQQQVREIKLTATTQLADPRISSNKYIVEKDNGKHVLHTVAGQDVDIMPLNRIAWGINPVSIPEALVKMPTLETAQSVGNIWKEIDNPADISIESGEIIEGEAVSSHETFNNNRKLNVKSSKRKELPVPVPNVDNIKNIKETKKQKINYKIPKLKNSDVSKQNKEVSLSKKHDYDDAILNKDFDDVNNLDIEKQLLCLAKGKKLNEGNDIKQNNSNVLSSNSQLPFLGNSEHRVVSAQEVVEGDLEMSDDNCDEDQLRNILKEAAISKKIATNVADNFKPPNVENEKELPADLEPVQLEESCHKKSKSKKKSKQKGTKASKIRDLEEPFKTTAIKTTHIKSKVSELFDDSSSLINPEDLGVESIPVTTTHMPDKSVPFFEDAVNVIDLNNVELTLENVSIPPAEPKAEENGPHCDPVVLCETENQESEDNAITKTNAESEDTNAITDEDIESIYENLEPGVSEHEENVQTVVISSGVQPVLAGEEEQVVSGKPNLKEKATTQDMALEALATSTPHKPWQLDVVPDGTDVKLSHAGCNPNNGSQKATVDNPIIDRSDNTMDSQTSDGNEPDVRIFAKLRRRKVAAKK